MPKNNFCIPIDVAERIKVVANRGLTTAKREIELTDILGDNKLAKEVNKLYEASTLLKKQELAEKRFYETITGLNKAQKDELLRNAAAERARKKALIYNTDGTVKDNYKALTRQTDDEIKERMVDFYERKYNIAVDSASITKIAKLKEETKLLKEAMEGTPKNSPQRMAYGDKSGEIIDILAEIKTPRDSLGVVKTLQASAKETGQRFTKEAGLDNITEGAKLGLEAVTSPVYKSIQASVDASFGLRQGFKQLVTDPKAWGETMKEALEPFKHMTKAEQQVVANKFRSSVLSHPDYDIMRRAGLAVGDITEDFFPTAVAEKIKGLGSIFKASNEAFTIFSQRTRIEMFERMIDTAKKGGVEVTEDMAKDFAKVANSISGRGHLGKLEANSGLLNKMFFSARFIRSQADTFLMPLDKTLSPIARKQATETSLRSFSGMAGLMTLASLFTDVEFDPRSSKFGKAKIPTSKDTYIDLSAGLGSYITFLSRVSPIIGGKTKSSKTGKLTDLNTGDFGSRTYWDVIVDWFSGKAAPAPSALIQFAKGRDYSGKKPTIGSAAQNLVTPISVQNVAESLTNEDLTSAILSTGFDVFGAGSTDYGKFK